MTSQTLAGPTGARLDIPTAPRQLGAARRLGADTATMIGRSMRLVTRDLDSMIMAIVLPVMLLLLFTYVFGGAMEVGTAYIQYATPGIILLCAGFGAANTAIAVEQDMSGGFVDRYRSMPVAASAVLTGHVVASVLKNLVTTAIVFGIALLIGFRSDAGVLGWAGAVGVIVLYVLTITWIATFVGTIVHSADAANGFTFFMLFLPYLSSAFVPPETMPSWLRGFAEHQPVTPMIETIRGLLGGPGAPAVSGSTALAAVIWGAGLSLLFAGLAAWAFGRRRTA